MAISRRFMQAIVVFYLTLTVIGCGPHVVSKHILGEHPVILEDEEWNGTWLNTEGAIVINVLNSEQGILQLAWIEEIEEELSLQSVTCQIMEGEKWLYWNLLEMNNESSEGEYWWGALKKEGRELVIWSTEPEAFRKAVMSKQLSGEIRYLSENNDEASASSYQVTLHDTPQNIITVVESMDSRSYFSWNEPLVLRKLGE